MDTTKKHYCAYHERDEPDDSRQLDVHHLDEDKANNDPSNLQTVCANCHRNLKHVGSRLKSK